MLLGSEKRETLKGMKVASAITLIFAGIFFGVSSLLLLIGMFIELGAVYGAICNMMWLSALMFFGLKVLKAVNREYEREEIFERLSKAEQQAIMDKKVEEYRREAALEAERRESTKKWSKVRTSKVQGQE